MQASVSPGEDRDKLSYLCASESIERVLRSSVDQVRGLSLELLTQLLLEPRQGVLEPLFQRADAFLGHARSPLFDREGMRSYTPTSRCANRFPGWSNL